MKSMRLLVLWVIFSAPLFGVLLVGALSARGQAAPDLIVVSADDPWMAAVAAPLAEHFRQVDEVPLLVAAGNPPRVRTNWLIERSGARQPLVLVPQEGWRLGPTLAALPAEVLPLGVDPVYGSLEIARRYWRFAGQAVAASVDDAQGVLLGALLAQSRAVPLLIRDRHEDAARLWADLAELGVRKITWVAGAGGNKPAWAAGGDDRVQCLSPADVQDEVVSRIGRDQIRTIVVARVPDEATCVGRTAWLAPYICAARKAPLILCRQSGGETAERLVTECIAHYHLKPRSALILADYDSIGTVQVAIDNGPPEAENGAAAEVAPSTAGPKAPTPAAADGPGSGGKKYASAVPADVSDSKLTGGKKAQKATAAATATAATAPAALAAPVVAAADAHPAVKYLVSREPCVRPELPQALPLGVGRLPTLSLEDASLMFARGLVRQRSLAPGAGQVLVIANSSPERRPLPMCEAVSRVTAEEFKNCRVPLVEFYGKSADSPEVLSAARDAHLIIYEGHVSYQDLIDVAYSHTTVPDDVYEESLVQVNRPPEPAGPTSSQAALPPWRPPLVPRKPNRLEEPLPRLPVVVLQSCDSIDESLMDRSDDLGCVAVVGSVTNIHSGSGSMLAQALADAMLYRRATLGEALRDAQNYLLCVEELKRRLGLKELAKGHRVALSFRLWGDPELPMIAPPQPGGDAAWREKPLAARCTGPGEITIDLPAARLPTTGNERYTARMFPGAEASGLVAKTGQQQARRLKSAYYFRLPLPPGFPVNGAKLEAASGGAGPAAALVDPLGRYLYVIYLPDVERPGTSVVLHYSAKPTAAAQP